MRVDELAPAPGANKAKKRVGRGIGGKGGKTAGAGTKGQHSRGRGKVARGFEGGQTALKQRVPEAEGLQQPVPRRVLARSTSTSSPALGVDDGRSRSRSSQRGLVRKGTFVKVLARGEITTAVARHRPRRVEGGRVGDHRRGR